MLGYEHLTPGPRERALRPQLFIAIFVEGNLVRLVLAYINHNVLKSGTYKMKNCQNLSVDLSPNLQKLCETKGVPLTSKLPTKLLTMHH
uniref:Uncharacterized protein n=1 Tax=Meloidogyne enterolobii TaxID=390850 RepID=A0A6V7V307_MELEN|nr:unnamed protein product [Meloidogyne enterolobii]